MTEGIAVAERAGHVRRARLAARARRRSRSARSRSASSRSGTAPLTRRRGSVRSRRCAGLARHGGCRGSSTTIPARQVGCCCSSWPTLGDSELALRLPSAVAVALAAGLLVVLGTMLLERVGGLVAGLAFAVNAGVIEASREARPYALGLLGVVLATLLFVLALERGGGWRWVPYAVAAAALPLTHPLAASVLAAHGAALIALRERRTAARGHRARRRDGDRRRAARVDGGRPLRRARRRRCARSLPARPRAARPIGCESRAGGRCCGAGSTCSSRRAGARSGRWRGVLVAALIAAPLVATLLAAVALPVFTGALVLCAPGIALAGGCGSPTPHAVRGPRLGGAGVVAGLVGGDDRRSPHRRPTRTGARSPQR